MVNIHQYSISMTGRSEVMGDPTVKQCLFQSSPVVKAIIDGWMMSGYPHDETETSRDFLMDPSRPTEET